VDDEWNPRLKGKKRYKYQREILDTSPIVGGMREYIETLMSRPETETEPNPEGMKVSPSVTLEAADYLDSVRDDMAHTWRAMLHDCFTAIWHGHAELEIVLKRRLGPNPGPGLPTSRHNDGRVGWHKIVLRSQDTIEDWEWSEDGSGDVVGVYQERQDGPEVFISMNKLFHVRFRYDRNNPEPSGALRAIERSYRFGNRIEDFEGIAIQRDAGGTMVAKMPVSVFSAKAGTAGALTRATMIEMAQLAGTDEFRGGGFPHATDPATGQASGYDLETLSSTQNIAAFDRPIVRHQTRMGIGLLLQWLFMAVENQGAMAAISAAQDVSQMAVGAKLAALFEQINRGPVRSLYRLTSFPEWAWASYKHGEISPLSPESLVQSVATLVSAGMPVGFDQEITNHLRQTLGLPLPDVGARSAAQPARAGLKRSLV